MAPSNSVSLYFTGYLGTCLNRDTKDYTEFCNYHWWHHDPHCPRRITQYVNKELAILRIVRRQSTDPVAVDDVSTTASCVGLRNRSLRLWFIWMGNPSISNKYRSQTQAELVYCIHSLSYYISVRHLADRQSRLWLCLDLGWWFDKRKWEQHQGSLAYMFTLDRLLWRFEHEGHRQQGGPVQNEVSARICMCSQRDLHKGLSQSVGYSQKVCQSYVNI